MRMAILLIIDGFGVGQMPDAPERDKGCNTLRSVSEKVEDLQIPNLIRMGLGNIMDTPGIEPVYDHAVASYGKCGLGYEGADTFDGHNEIMGSRIKPHIRQYFRDVMNDVKSSLIEKGYEVTEPLEGKPIMLVNGSATIADNLEVEPGRSVFNITAALDYMSADKLFKLARIVRNVPSVKVSRVIAFGSTGYPPERMLECVRTDEVGRVGVDAPMLNVYDENYQVIHLGYGVDPERQIPSILCKNRIKVVLMSKCQDLIQCQGAIKIPVVATQDTTDLVLGQMDSTENGFIAATYQETDLAGHEQDVRKYAALLETIDEGVGDIIEKLQDEDILIVTGDHGNDPLKGHAWHTREYTPLLVMGKKVKAAVKLGVRRSLSDIAATIADIFGVEKPENGESFYGRLS